MAVSFGKTLLQFLLVTLLVTGSLSYDEGYEGGYGDDYGDYGEGGGGAGGEDSPDSKLKGVIDLDEFTFRKVIDGSKPAFVEFYAPWCGHCKEFKNEYEELGEALGPHPELILAKVDAEANEALAKEFNVEGYPTMVYIAKDGSREVYDGEQTMDAVRDFLVDRVGDVGQLKILEPLVNKFLKSEKAQRPSVIKETEAEIAKLSTTDAGYGKWYGKIMNNVVKKGDTYLKAEFERLLRIVYDQVDALKEEKLAEFRVRLAVLKHFDPTLSELEKAKKAEVKAREEAEAEGEAGEGGEGEAKEEL
uniref:protein disulfide-isomerase n=1 Tax=Tetraselmis sp. GSL018 TaxID=582737 RepID=A0A061S950_9CHLO|mmetsp:Transcript_11698/g.27791  ORF Transcript_11698/g.27791 Transcript_11698/m.27791 type:complete len:304 (-) Transcript_11698:164-1075(-)|eukprot:CAMPEP_0177598610 /NCGR_PEP_ID=MMETSP0419_2-20121207/12468_1 /TAXON_ID=582737 /ORGANISM="Tetraselmis sp., Strain GSL018" /LENGTH=303 /DNA_ID=CAMNT_0019091121 /DNA_START=83 /DNA_END=994 /DNA_ORIENTATION=-